MPMGRFDSSTGGFEFTVSVDYPATNADLFTHWTRALRKAAELFYHATDGQLRITRFRIANQSYGLREAEIVLHELDSASYATRGGFGAQVSVLNGNVYALSQTHLMADCKTVPMIIVHELGHHALALGDEYTGPYFHANIRSLSGDELAEYNALPEAERHARIPIDGTPEIFDGDALVGEGEDQDQFYVLAGLRWGSVFERKRIVESSHDWIVVDEAYTQSPLAAANPVTFQDLRQRCFEPPQDEPDASPPHAFYCLMQNSRRAGEFDVQGVWIPFDQGPPGTDFCSESTHEIGILQPDAGSAPNTHQSDVNNDESCWQTIQRVLLQRYGYPLNAPDPPVLGPSTGSPFPANENDLFEYLIPERRVALVIDRSGSMNIAERMPSAREATRYWVERLLLEEEDDTRMAVVTFNQGATLLQPLATPSEIAPGLVETIMTLPAQGLTNMVGGLELARQQVRSDPPRAATQTVVLLTDGWHNHPQSTSLVQVIPGYGDDRIQIFPIGLGTSEYTPGSQQNWGAVDMAGLRDLAQQTGGSYPILANNATAAEDRIKELYDFILGGLVASAQGSLDALPDHPGDPGTITSAPGKRPKLTSLAKQYEIGTLKDLIAGRRPQRNTSRWRARFVVEPIFVERDSSRLSVTLSFPAIAPLWLYLITPSGKAHNMAASDTQMISQERTEFAVVKQPTPGLWYAVGFRPTGGGSLHWRLCAGSRNRRLAVDARASSINPPGSPVLLDAGAVWGDRLSGLSVVAQIRAPDGTLANVTLSDGATGEAEDGAYRGAYTPTSAGRHDGVIRIGARGVPIQAQMAHRLSHAGNDLKHSGRLELKPIAGPFRRLVPVSFWSGDLPKSFDLELFKP